MPEDIGSQDLIFVWVIPMRLRMPKDCFGLLREDSVVKSVTNAKTNELRACLKIHKLLCWAAIIAEKSSQIAHLASKMAVERVTLNH
jgi:hypothetical protein